MSDLVNYTYWHWEGALSKEFCHAALEQIDWATSSTGVIGQFDAPVIDLEKRRTDVVLQDFMQPLGSLARVYIDTANQSAGWNFDLLTQEQTQIGRYKSSDEGHYDWHMDSQPPIDGRQRKLSISILLSDPSEFEGGELQFKGMEDGKILTKQGSIVVFPSFIEHKVTPVTKGVRYSAVTWASGPSFR